MTRYDILEAVERYGLEAYPKPRNYYCMTTSKFEEMSYKNWAVEELLDYLWKKESVAYPVIDRVEMFKNMVGEFALKHKSIDSVYMFSIAEDVSNDILDFLISLLTWRDEDE